MSTETVDLREYVDRRFEDQVTAVQAALVAADKAVSAALIAQEKAVLKKEEEVERWRAAANEWRGAMSDRERDFLGRKEFYSIIGTAVAVISFVTAFYRR